MMNPLRAMLKSELRRSVWYLATALDVTSTPAQRKMAWECSEVEHWFEAVCYRRFPVMAVPRENIVKVMSLLRERNREPLSGTRIRP